MLQSYNSWQSLSLISSSFLSDEPLNFLCFSYDSTLRVQELSGNVNDPFSVELRDNVPRTCLIAPIKKFLRDKIKWLNERIVKNNYYIYYCHTNNERIKFNWFKGTFTF